MESALNKINKKKKTEKIDMENYIAKKKIDTTLIN